VATAIHAGHDVRPAIGQLLAVDDVTRRREEDPLTDVIIDDFDGRCVVHRSRFEVDLNRPRDTAVYRTADDAWGLTVWKLPLPDRDRQESLSVYDEFYAALGEVLDSVAARGPFLVLDVHSYNHRRDGAAAEPAAVDANPEVNVGTGALADVRWGPVARRFIGELGSMEVAGHRLDVRQNVRFRGGHLARWVADRYPTTACPLAIELKKVFMDEWTGVHDADHVAQLRRALTTVGVRVADTLTEQ
jgi:N-formylglutamate amidohydrolase